MPKAGNKFGTLHKFGKRRRRRKKRGDQGSVLHKSNSVTGARRSQPSTSTSVPSTVASSFPVPSSPAVPSSSRAEPASAMVASFRKMDYFKAKRQANDSSGEESDRTSASKKRRQERDPQEVDDGEVVQRQMNVIVDLSSLQSLISQGGIQCPRCRESVSLIHTFHLISDLSKRSF